VWRITQERYSQLERIFIQHDLTLRQKAGKELIVEIRESMDHIVKRQILNSINQCQKCIKIDKKLEIEAVVTINNYVNIIILLCVTETGTTQSAGFSELGL